MIVKSGMRSRGGCALHEETYGVDPADLCPCSLFFKAIRLYAYLGSGPYDGSAYATQRERERERERERLMGSGYISNPEVVDL